MDSITQTDRFSSFSGEILGKGMCDEVLGKGLVLQGGASKRGQYMQLGNRIVQGGTDQAVR